MKKLISYSDLQFKFQEIVAENARLRDENSHLKALLGMNAKETEVSFQTNNELPHQQVIIPTVTNSSFTDEKVAIFRGLFKGRTDVGTLGREGWKNRIFPGLW
ncbi:MAG: hypothetical protein ACOY46_17520 [Bacillota bacterium]